jgi:hypothetical protein
LNALGRLAGPRRIHGHRNDTRVKTTEERGDEVESRGVHEQRTITNSAMFAEGRGNRARSTVEVCVGELIALFLA